MSEQGYPRQESPSLGQLTLPMSGRRSGRALRPLPVRRPDLPEAGRPPVLCMGNPRDVIDFIFSSTKHNAVSPGSGTPSPLFDVSAFTT